MSAPPHTQNPSASNWARLNADAVPSCSSRAGGGKPAAVGAAVGAPPPPPPPSSCRPRALSRRCAATAISAALLLLVLVLLLLLLLVLLLQRPPLSSITDTRQHAHPAGRGIRTLRRSYKLVEQGNRLIVETRSD